MLSLGDSFPNDCRSVQRNDSSITSSCEIAWVAYEQALSCWTFTSNSSYTNSNRNRLNNIQDVHIFVHRSYYKNKVVIYPTQCQNNSTRRCLGALSRRFIHSNSLRRLHVASLCSLLSFYPVVKVTFFRHSLHFFNFYRKFAILSKNFLIFSVHGILIVRR